MKESVRRELVRLHASLLPVGREGGKVRNALDFSLVGEPSLSATRESRVSRGWVCLGVPAAVSSCLGTAVGSKALAQA